MKIKSNVQKYEHFIVAKPEINLLKEISEAFKVHSFENDLYHCQRTLPTGRPESKNATSEHDSVQRCNGREKKKREGNLGEIL